MPLPSFTDVTLVLTEQCNLRCPYCYVPKTERRMSDEVALQAADFLLDRAPVDAAVSLAFFGGEPFLARPLMEQVVAHARSRRPEGLSFTTPTNGLMLDGDTLAFVRSCGMRLALSIDGTEPGADKGAESLRRLQPLLPDLRQIDPIVRLTVTPENVGNLCDNIVSLFALGFRRIMHSPAIERPWDEAAVQSWGEQHRRVADWACERYEERLMLPELLTLEGIVSRLGGQAARYCGAGVTTAAVGTDGRVFGCYRSVYDPHPERMALGDIFGGPVNETLVAAYARLDPARARPERGNCRSCDARQGCTCYCAAMGHVLLGDLRAVSADACTLMRVQVEVCRDASERMRRIERARRRSVGAHVAAAALALSLATTAAACDSNRPTVPVDAKVTDGPKQKNDLGIGPGLCPVKIDQSVQKNDLGIGPGICPVMIDQGVQKNDLGIGPGLCPVMIDQSVKKNDLGIGPGICMPGLCPVMPDQSMPKSDLGIGPGLCPIPGLC